MNRNSVSEDIYNNYTNVSNTEKDLNNNLGMEIEVRQMIKKNPECFQYAILYIQNFRNSFWDTIDESPCFPETIGIDPRIRKSIIDRIKELIEWNSIQT